jgi:hypothetical protein
MKKTIRILLLMMIALIPGVANAASGSISFSASNTVMLGNTVTVTVKLSSSAAIGSWEMDLNYDKSYLQLTKSGAESGGTRMANSVSSGIKSKSYTFTFKTLKTGTTKVSVGSYLAYDFNTMSQISLTSSSKSISIKTKEQIEATYSDNAFLSSLTVGDYALNPAFDKNVFEYTVEVEPDKESVTIDAKKADSNASVSGTGDVTLFEGSNKFEIVVTAQKGNTNKYVLNIIRKELEPVSVSVDGKDYMLVRNAKALEEHYGFTLSTITYNGYEDVPALVNDTINYTIVGLKDNDTVKMFIYDNGVITQEYIELKDGNSIITPLEMKDSEIFSKYYSLDDLTANVGAKCYKINDNYKIIYALDIISGESNYYLYNEDAKSFMIYDGSIEAISGEKNKVYKYIIYGFMAFSGLLLLICLFGKSGNKKEKKNKKKIKKEEVVEEEVEEEYVEDLTTDEAPEEVEEVEETEEVEEEPIPEEEVEVKELNIDEDTVDAEPMVDKKALKKQKAEEKKKAKEEKAKAKKEAKEQKRKIKEMDW